MGFFAILRLYCKLKNENTLKKLYKIFLHVDKLGRTGYTNKIKWGK